MPSESRQTWSGLPRQARPVRPGQARRQPPSERRQSHPTLPPVSSPGRRLPPPSVCLMHLLCSLSQPCFLICSLVVFRGPGGLSSRPVNRRFTLLWLLVFRLLARQSEIRLNLLTFVGLCFDYAD